MNVWDVNEPSKPSRKYKYGFFVEPAYYPENYGYYYVMSGVQVSIFCGKIIVYTARYTVHTIDMVTGEHIQYTKLFRDAFIQDGLLIQCNPKTVITNLIPVDHVVPLLVADVLPSDILYDVFKLL
jgi:hypothetical protein